MSDSVRFATLANVNADTGLDGDVAHIFRWDLDKTYLRTEFDTWIDLMRTAIERPERKRTVPGAAALMRELRAIACTVRCGGNALR